ncbi:MAG: hypothetical protein U0531_15295 [Dehalococcoidia bacterium]
MSQYVLVALDRHADADDAALVTDLGEIESAIRPPLLSAIAVTRASRTLDVLDGHVEVHPVDDLAPQV